MSRGVRDGLASHRFFSGPLFDAAICSGVVMVAQYI
jgi:hypothetical protein